MNPITNTKNQNRINQQELKLGYTGTASSWHRQYKDSAWIFVGGLHYDLTEGDIICVFSQYGEIVNINLVRDMKTGRSKGFAFLCYEDQRSTVLATDNLNGIKLAGRIIRVDHVENYKVPKEGTLSVGASGKKERKPLDPAHKDDVAAFVREKGCAPEVMKELKKIEKQQKIKAEKESANRSSRRIRSSEPESSLNRERHRSKRSRSPHSHNYDASKRRQSSRHSGSPLQKVFKTEPPDSTAETIGHKREHESLSPPRASKFRRDFRDRSPHASNNSNSYRNK